MEHYVLLLTGQYQIGLIRSGPFFPSMYILGTKWTRNTHVVRIGALNTYDIAKYIDTYFKRGIYRIFQGGVVFGQECSFWEECSIHKRLVYADGTLVPLSILCFLAPTEDLGGDGWVLGYATMFAGFYRLFLNEQTRFICACFIGEAQGRTNIVVNGWHNEQCVPSTQRWLWAIWIPSNWALPGMRS